MTKYSFIRSFQVAIMCSQYLQVMDKLNKMGYVNDSQIYNIPFAIPDKTIYVRVTQFDDQDRIGLYAFDTTPSLDDIIYTFDCFLSLERSRKIKRIMSKI